MAWREMENGLPKTIILHRTQNKRTRGPNCTRNHTKNQDTQNKRGGEQQPTSLVGDWRISNQNGSNTPISRMQSKQFQESQWNMNTKIRNSIVDLCGQASKADFLTFKLWIDLGACVPLSLSCCILSSNLVPFNLAPNPFFFPKLRFSCITTPAPTTTTISCTTRQKLMQLLQRQNKTIKSQTVKSIDSMRLFSLRFISNPKTGKIFLICQHNLSFSTATH